MSRILHHVSEAILQSLIEQAQATAAVVVLTDSAAENPHILAQVGRLTSTGWASLLQKRSPNLFIQPLTPSNALLVVHAAGRLHWNQIQQSLIQAAGLSLEYIFRTDNSELEWQQLTASHRILPVTEEELCRIVLDVHDGPVQKIYSALNHVSHLQHLTERTLPPTLPHQPDLVTTYQSTLEQVANLLETSLTEIRTFLGAFHSPEFKEQALLDVLEGLILQHETLTGTTVHFEAALDIPLVSVPIKIALYRILQEALANGVRHASVAEHFVHLWVHQDKVYLEVIDHGTGFKPPSLTGLTATERAEHIGLRGMRDRTQLVGGTFELFSKPTQGTRIKVKVPYHG